jgi:hypothetical protein
MSDLNACCILRGYVTQWDVFYDQIQPLATQVPWMVGAALTVQRYVFITFFISYLFQVTSFSLHCLLQTSVGNHERDHPFSGDRFDMAFDSGGECGVPYELRYVPFPISTPMSSRSKRV